MSSSRTTSTWTLLLTPKLAQFLEREWVEVEEQEEAEVEVEVEERRMVPMKRNQARKSLLQMRIHRPRRGCHHHLPRHHMKTSKSGNKASTPVRFPGSRGLMPDWMPKISGWPSITLEPRCATPSRCGTSSGTTTSRPAPTTCLLPTLVRTRDQLAASAAAWIANS
ncbi:hypothetical protein LINGRAHAP2_LOCUS10054, partial [Linum grandiflorum]